MIQTGSDATSCYEKLVDRIVGPLSDGSLRNYLPGRPATTGILVEGLRSAARRPPWG